MRQYLRVWRIPGGPTLLGVGIVARLGIGMTPLAVLMLLEHVTGRYALAAVAVGIYALSGAALSPVAGRIADRVGPTPVLLVTAVAHPLAVALLLLASRGGAGNLAAVYACAALAGATYPQLTAAIRGAFTDITEPGTPYHALRGAAMAAETSLFELVFVLGPLAVSLFLITVGPAAALAASAAVTFVGTVVVARGRILRSWRPQPRRTVARGLGPLRVPGFPAMLLCVGSLGTAFGAAEVTVPAYAGAHGAGDGLGGVLLGIWGVGSATAGIWYGTRQPAMPPVRQLAWLLGGVSTSFFALSVMPSPTALGIALVLGGASIAPALTVANTMVGRIAPNTMLNEAYTWVGTVSIAASAAGGAVAGLIVDQIGGAPLAFVSAGAVLAVAALLAALPSGSLARADARASARVVEALASDCV